MGHLHKTMAIVFILISFFTGACGNRSAGETGSNAKEFITEILAEAHDNGVNVEVNNISLSDMQMSVVMTYYYDDGKEANDMDIFPQCIINGMPMDADYSASGKTFNSDNTKIQQTFYINYGDAIPDKNNLVEINADVCRTQTGEIEDIAQISISLNDVVCKDAVSDSVRDVARFDVENLLEAMFAGDAPKALRIVENLNAAGESIPSFMWMITEELRMALEVAVRRQMMSDVPYGVLLSGGLDSSVISAVAQKYARKRIESGGREAAWWPRLHSFAVGLHGAPDLEKARLVARHIGTVHHEINYTIQEGLDALSDVVYFTETYDVTTIRASTPMYLLARVIKSMGIKMVLSGEGADEVFGGYLYFHKAPDARAFHEETVRKLSRLHLYDCLRANKSLAAWGVEGRVPFLDTVFLDVAMRINPSAKMCPGSTMEKRILREAFAPLLPAEVAWRQKEQFSDGVGYSWIDTLKRIATESVSDDEMAHAAGRFPVNPPRNKEEYFYRTLFASHFPSDSAAATVPSVPSVACSTAEALAWDKAFAGKDEPSGRAVGGVHRQAYT